MSVLPALNVQGQPCLDGATHVVLERSAPWPADEIAAIEAVMDIFLAAAARSAYACPTAPPGGSSLTLLYPGVAAANDLTFSLQAVQVDARAFQILRHMASRLEPAGGATLLRINVTCAAQSQAPRVAFPAIDFENEDDQYPEAPPNPGFRVEWDDTLSYAKSRRVLVELATRPERPALDELEAYVVDWGRLLEAGAFAMPLGLPDVIDSVMGSVSQLDRFTAEIEIPVYQASECGLDVLLQVLVAYHLRVRPIELVTIE